MAATSNAGLVVDIERAGLSLGIAGHHTVPYRALTYAPQGTTEAFPCMSTFSG